MHLSHRSRTWPWLQGRQARFVEITLSTLQGPNLCSQLDPNIAMTLVPTAAAICIGPVSFVMNSWQRLIIATVCWREVTPAKFRTLRPDAAAIAVPIKESLGPPRTTILQL